LSSDAEGTGRVQEGHFLEGGKGGFAVGPSSVIDQNREFRCVGAPTQSKSC
jgi:hypothetical protein